MSEQQKPELLIVDDDEIYCEVLSRALNKRGYQARVAFNLDSAELLATEHTPPFAIVDLRINQESGLDAVEKLIAIRPDIRIVVLTGFASISTAVHAIKLGATQYLTKPTEVDEIIKAFYPEQQDEPVELSTQPMSTRRLEWEHLQKVLLDHNGNISRAAQAMGMHRRTLQRKLNKRPVNQ